MPINQYRRMEDSNVRYNQKATTFDSTSTPRQVNPTSSNSGGITAAYGIRGDGTNSALLNELYNEEEDLLLDNGISDIYRENWYSNYSRIGYVDPYNTHKKTKEYLFFTKPALNLSNVTATSSFFADAINRYSNIVQLLDYDQSRDSGPFVPLLTNAVNGSLELPSISADTIETARNVYGIGLSYRGTSMKSDADFEFSLDFRDSKFLDVYMWFKMYDEYERLKWMGEVSPRIYYIQNKILHDQFSIYKFIVAEDGMTLLYWARAMGVMPLSVPRESMANIEGELTFSVNFKAQFVSDMDPRILADFNNIGYGDRGSASNLPLFNTSTKRFNGQWASGAYIHTRNGSTDNLKRNKYYLMWF